LVCEGARRAVPLHWEKTKKGLSPFNPAIWPYVIFSSGLKILPIKDSRFLSVPYLFGVDDFFIFLI